VDFPSRQYFYYTINFKVYNGKNLNWQAYMTMKMDKGAAAHGYIALFEIVFGRFGHPVFQFRQL